MEVKKNEDKEKKGIIACLTPGMKKLAVILFSLAGTVLSIYIGGYVMLVEPGISLYRSFMAHTLGIKELFSDIISFSLAATVGGTVWCIFDIIAGLFREKED
ncbi:MAG: hypothetical protein K5851_08145 [Lachnospiraceae bacterium]|nr:hypothetical protein [Lachnospiraceae bacterium]